MLKPNTIFEMLELMEKLRDILRQTAPLHEFNLQQRDEVKQILEQAKKRLTELEESIL
ncbi:MAG: hypothetical protein QME81_02670 [bacterium]|nr:hypothetical protein [bacterium]